MRVQGVAGERLMYRIKNTNYHKGCFFGQRENPVVNSIIAEYMSPLHFRKKKQSATDGSIRWI